MPKQNKRKSSKPKTHPVPEWMPEHLKKATSELDVTERLELADRLEKDAELLREFQEKRIKADSMVTIPIFPSQKKALEHWAKVHGDKSGNVDTGARWLLEIACTMLDQINDRNSAFVKYREAEGIEDSHLCESWVEQSLAKYKAAFTKNDDDDNDDPTLPGDKWKNG